MPFGRLTLGRTRSAAVCTAAALVLMLAACGGGDDEPAPDEEPENPTNTAGTVNLNGAWPLTGQALDGDPPKHPVYVVKIDNTGGSEPQVGLNSADLVVEELVEGGLTRLAVFYYQEMPKTVGPVRSMRATDIGIVSPVGGTIITSGAAPRTTARIERAGIPVLSEGSNGFYRDGSRSAPYNLLAELTSIADKPGKDWSAPEDPYLPFGDEDEFNGGTTVKSITADFSAGHTTGWEYDGKSWGRPDSLATPGKDFEPDNILLLRVRTRDAGYKDFAGNPVPESVFQGKGEAVLVHGDKALECRWSKPLLESPLKLRMKNGDPVVVPVGNTWIELVPTDGGQVRLAK